MLGRLGLGAALLVSVLVGCAGSGDGGATGPSQDVVGTDGVAATAGSDGTTGATTPVRALVVHSLANLGDSISQGYDADDSIPINMDRVLSNASTEFHDNVEYSWVQGTDERIGSATSYWKGLDPALTAHPFSRSGAELVGRPGGRPNLADQATQLVGSGTHPDLVYVLLGGNDVCNRARNRSGDPTANMYTVEDWTAAAQKGLEVLAAGLDAGATVRVLSMPRVDRLYEELGDAKVSMKYGGIAASMSCKQFWTATSATDSPVCPIVTLEPDDARRAAIGDRIDAYNDALATVVRKLAQDSAKNPKGIRFQTDWHGAEGTGGTRNGSMGTYHLTDDLVSKRDCFHPSLAGQKQVANLALHVAIWD